MATVNSLMYLMLASGLTTETPVTRHVSTSDRSERTSDFGISTTPATEPDLFTEGSTWLGARRNRTCASDEHFTRCEVLCQVTCENYRKPIACPKICMWGCVCNTGLIRGPDKKCIKPEECPGKSAPAEVPSCPAQEHWEPCSAKCQKTCRNYKRPFPCPAICVPGCICDKGLVRGPDGKCINTTECDKRSESAAVQKDESCPANERMESCSAHCQKSCKNLKPICPRICIKGCVCLSGFVRGPKGDCIKRHECPASSDEYGIFPNIPVPHLCGKNEVFKVCPSSCPDDCNNYQNTKRDCKRSCFSVPGCVCKKGLVRGPFGKCITPVECPRKDKTCPAGEIFSDCSANCEKNCSNWFQRIDCKDKCVPGCICRFGHIRGSTGNCILPFNCPRNIKLPDDEITTVTPPSDRTTDEKGEISKENENCPPQEHWDVCSAHCQKNCTNYDKDIPCKAICTPGCICDEGLVRGTNGKCIKPDECQGNSENTQEDQKCPPDEHHIFCFANCQMNCTNYENFDRNLPCVGRCIPGCVCDEGFVRGPDGICIKPERCDEKAERQDTQRIFPNIPIPLLCGKNEVFNACPSSCPDDCNNYQNTKRDCKTSCIPVPGCVCKKGLVRGPTGKCITPVECPRKDKTCPAGEMFSDCSANCEKNCSNWFHAIDCKDKCVPGCICRMGRIRGPTGNCILPFKCPRNIMSSDDAVTTATPRSVETTDANAETTKGEEFAPDDCIQDECRRLCRGKGGCKGKRCYCFRS